MTQLSSPVNLIKESVNIFSKKENLIFFLKVYSPLVPFAIFSIFQNYLVNPDSYQTANPVLAILVTVINILYALVYVLVSVAGIEAIRKVIEGDKLVVKTVFKFGWKNYWKFLVLSVLVTLITGIGFVILIVPGILALVWYSFARFAFVEDTSIGVIRSLGRSKDLVKGKFWKVFGRLFVFGIFSFLLGIITSVMPYGVGNVLAVFLEALFILPSYLLYKELKG